MKEYEPSKKEVRAQMFKDVKSFGKKVSNIRNIKDFSVSLIGSTFVTGTYPYIIPRVYRAFKEHTSSCTSQQNRAEEYGMGPGIVLGICSWFAQMWGYGYLASKGHAKALLIPLATNLASGIYELGAKWKKNARERVRYTKGLEDNLESK